MRKTVAYFQPEVIKKPDKLVVAEASGGMDVGIWTSARARASRGGLSGRRRLTLLSRHTHTHTQGKGTKLAGIPNGVPWAERERERKLGGVFSF